MKTLFNRNTGIAAFAAVVIVGLTGLTLDRGHQGALPKGIVEIGSLEAVMVGDLTIASLPAVVVTGSRDVQLADVAADVDAQG
jgi:predicted transcriptional regulator